MSLKTPLFDLHQKVGAVWCDFFGWTMPIHYGSQLHEHQQVRQAVGIFDVSHMGIIDIKGKDSRAFLRYVLANDIAKLKGNGQALYSCLLNENGGVLDDLIAYVLDLDNEYYRLVVNASRTKQDFAWLRDIQQQRSFQCTLSMPPDLCIIAIQGPQAIDLITAYFHLNTDALNTIKPFHCYMQNKQNTIIARTGYTGEDGVEIMLPSSAARKLWEALIEAGATPCGLAARDTLRLEAGLNLYGSDMDESTSPLTSNLGWTIALQDSTRDFIGRTVIEKEKMQPPKQQLLGLIMQARGVLRPHQPVLFLGDNNELHAKGQITSGSYSPTLQHAIALARLPVSINNQPISTLSTFIRRRTDTLPVQLVLPPFVRHGKACYRQYNHPKYES